MPRAGRRHRLRPSRARPSPPTEEPHSWRPASRSRWRSTTTSRWATSAGSSPRSTISAYLPMLEALERHPGVRLLAPLHRARCSSGSRRSGRSSSSGWARSSSAARSSSWAAACTSRSSPPCRSSDRVDQLAPDGRARRGALAGRRPQRRLARRARLGAGPAHVARRGRLPLDHPRRPALPGAPRSPRRTSGAPYTTEDQGNLLTVFGTEQGLRYRIPFGTVEDVIGYLRDHATEAGDRVGDDGRRRREVRRLAHDLRALLGQGPLGRPVLRARSRPTATGSRRSRRRRWLDAQPADRPRLRADVLIRGDGRVGAAARRAGGVHAAAPRRRWRSTGPRPAGCAAASGATSRSATARSTTSTSRCCATSAKVARDGRRAGRALRRWTTSTAASRTTATGTGCSAASTSRTCASPPYEHLIAAEDAADAALGTVRDAPSSSTSTWTAFTEALLPSPARWSRSSRPRAAASAAWDIRAARHALACGAPAAAGGLPRDACAPTRPRRSPRKDGDPRGWRRSARRSTISSWSRRTGLAARLHYDDHERRSGLVRFLEPSTTPAAFARRRRAGAGRLPRRRVRRSTALPPGLVALSRDGTRAPASRSP